MNDILIEIMLEYIQNKYYCYEQDYERVKERIQLYSLDPESLQDFVICKTRLDCKFVNEIQKIRGSW